MKKISIPSVFLIALTLFIQGCLGDDRLDFPEETEDVELTESLSIVALLNYHTKEASLPFDFVYPIHLGYPNDISIEITDKTGLRQAAVSQNRGLYIDRVSFPLLVKIGQTLRNLDTEDDFKNLLIETSVPTLRDKIGEHLSQCFELVFPISLVVNGVETEFSDISQIQLFIATQPLDYQPEIVFPGSLIVYSKGNEPIVVSNIFELFKVFDSCGGCPEVSFVYSDTTLYNYVFEAQYDEMDSITEFEWYVNGTFKENGPKLERFLEPGNYEVCLKAYTSSCQLGSELYCEAVVVENKCPELFYESTKLARNRYKFFAAFEAKDRINYKWVVIRRSQIIEEDPEPIGQQDHFFEYEFDSLGVYTVCLKALELEECLEDPHYCEDAIIDSCPDLFFRMENEGSIYHFIADFEGMRDIFYRWVIYQDDQVYSEINVSPGESNILIKEFPTGSYTIFLKAKPDGCPEEVAYSQEFEVP